MAQIPITNLTTIDFLRLISSSDFDRGGEAEIYRSGKPNTLYKIFDYEEAWNPEFVYSNKLEKLTRIYSMPQLDSWVHPVSIINVDGEFAGYEMTYDPLDTSLDSFYLPYDKKIECLRRIKSNLIDLHFRGVTYGDIKSNNILINRQTFVPKFCDIDNVQIGNLSMDVIPETIEKFADEYDMVDSVAVMYAFNFLVLEQLAYPGASFPEILRMIQSNECPECFEKEAGYVLDSMLSPRHFSGETIIQYAKKK